MGKLWEKFSVHCEYGELEFLTIRSVADLKKYRNIYQLQLDFGDSESNFVIIADKRFRFILGMIKCRTSINGAPLIASQQFDIFPIERLDLHCLEVVGLQIHEEAWNRPLFRYSVGQGILMMMQEVGSEAVVVHITHKCQDINRSIWTFVHLPLKSSVIYCEPIEKNLVYKIDETLQDSTVHDVNPFSKEFDHLTKLGFEIWSEPKVNYLTSEISLFLGFIAPSVRTHLRAFSLQREVIGRNSDAFV